MTRATLLTLAIVASVAVAPSAPGAEREEGVFPASHTDPRIRVEHDPEAFTTKISIPSEDGRVTWSDVLRGLALARGFDDAALEGLLPDGDFRFTGLWGRLLRGGLNLGLGSRIRFVVERPVDEQEEPRLVIELDEAALLASQRRFKAWLREALLSRREGREPAEFGLAFDESWDQAPTERKLVILVHGLDSEPELAGSLLVAPRNEGFPCAVFRYPNDQPIADSARLLSSELARLAQEHPRRRVSLLTHSMGGLVARAVIEDPQLDPGNVGQLIMIAPPNHGSALARFRFGLEIWEHVARKDRRLEMETFYASIEDGLSEAAADLRPGSPFLRDLNARRRNADLKYTIFLGTGGWLSEHELTYLRDKLAAGGERSRWVKFFGPYADQWLADLDEVVAGKGDGVVSVERGRLEGVDDTLVLDFGHVDVLRPPAHDAASSVHQEVLERLKAPP